jgi:hypothetical protein
MRVTSWYLLDHRREYAKTPVASDTKLEGESALRSDVLEVCIDHVFSRIVRLVGRVVRHTCVHPDGKSDGTGFD